MAIVPRKEKHAVKKNVWISDRQENKASTARVIAPRLVFYIRPLVSDTAAATLLANIMAFRNMRMSMAVHTKNLQTMVPCHGIFPRVEGVKLVT